MIANPAANGKKVSRMPWATQCACCSGSVVKVSIELKLRLRVLVEEWPLTSALVLPSGSWS